MVLREDLTTHSRRIFDGSYKRQGHFPNQVTQELVLAVSWQIWLEYIWSVILTALNLLQLLLGKVNRILVVLPFPSKIGNRWAINAMNSFELQGNFFLSTFHRSVVTMSSTTRSNLWTGTGVTTSPPDRLSHPYRNWSRVIRPPSARLILYLCFTLPSFLNNLRAFAAS